MPLTLIRIENVNQKWICEAELGGLTAFRKVLRDDTLDGMLRQISATYHEHEGTEDPLAIYNAEGATFSAWMTPNNIRAESIAALANISSVMANIPNEAVPMRSSAELYAEAGTTAETADADREKADADMRAYGTGFMKDGKHIPAEQVFVDPAPQNTDADIVQARAELHAQAAEQAPWGRKKDGTPKKRPGRSAA